MPLDIEKMRSVRERMKLTQEVAAQAAGMSGRQQWNDVESGRKGNVSIATLEAIAKALKISPKSLLK